MWFGFAVCDSDLELRFTAGSGSGLGLTICDSGLLVTCDSGTCLWFGFSV